MMYDIEHCNHETLMQYLEQIKERIKSLPETAEECHKGSEASKSQDFFLQREKQNCISSIVEIKDFLSSFIPEDKKYD